MQNYKDRFGAAIGVTETGVADKTPTIFIAIAPGNPAKDGLLHRVHLTPEQARGFALEIIQAVGRTEEETKVVG